jgi:hypothetical protein
MPYPSCVQNPSSRNAITCPLDAACWHNATAAGMSRLTSPPPAAVEKDHCQSVCCLRVALGSGRCDLGVCSGVPPPGERRSGGIPVRDGGAVLVAYNYTPRHFPHR